MKGGDYMSTVIIGLIVAVILFLAGRRLYKDKSSGRSSCGGSCSGCPNCCACHKEHSAKSGADR